MTKKSTTGRKCSACTHERVDQINREIVKGASFRSIAKAFEMTHQAVSRHTTNCLSLELAALIQAKKERQAIDVQEEFTEQLAFAKKLRIAAEEVLSDPLDPLKLILIPRADEIEVVYYDHGDLNEQNMPKKKRAQLSVLLQRVEEFTEYSADKYTIKHVDVRSFALDCIHAADTCIDRFAKMGGLYQKEKKNAQDLAEIAKKVVEKLIYEKGWDEGEAWEYANQTYKPTIKSNAIN